MPDTSSLTPNISWYAIQTRPRWEKKVAGELDKKGIEHYCPLNKVLRQWSDRRKVILEPVFKGYVFVRPVEEKKWDIKKVDGILNYVYWLGKPAVIRDEEINTIRKFLMEFEEVTVENSNLTINSKVRVTRGVLMNYEGMVLEVHGSRAIVKIDSMGLVLSAHFDKKNLQPVL